MNYENCKIKPYIINKKEISIGIYFLGYIKDTKLNRMLENN